MQVIHAEQQTHSWTMRCAEGLLEWVDARLEIMHDALLLPTKFSTDYDRSWRQCREHAAGQRAVGPRDILYPAQLTLDNVIYRC